MKNKEVFNICYKFLNKYITSKELVEELGNIDKNSFEKEEKKSFEKLFNDINEIIKNIPNEVDEYIIKEKETIKKIIKRLEALPKDDNNIEFLNNQIEGLKKEYDKETDSYKRLYEIVNYIIKNDYFNEIFDSC